MTNKTCPFCKEEFDLNNSSEHQVNDLLDQTFCSWSCSSDQMLEEPFKTQLHERLKKGEIGAEDIYYESDAATLPHLRKEFENVRQTNPTDSTQSGIN